MRKIKVSAHLPYVNGLVYSLEELGLEENATEEEIQKAVYELILDDLDWGWIENHQ